jgi:hypothetical protein
MPATSRIVEEAAKNQVIDCRSQLAGDSPPKSPASHTPIKPDFARAVFRPPLKPILQPAQPLCRLESAVPKTSVNAVFFNFCAILYGLRVLSRSSWFRITTGGCSCASPSSPSPCV